MKKKVLLYLPVLAIGVLLLGCPNPAGDGGDGGGGGTNLPVGGGSTGHPSPSLDQWENETRLEAPAGTSVPYFGAVVAVSSDGNTIVVGNHIDDRQTGGVGAGTYAYGPLFAYRWNATASSWNPPIQIPIPAELSAANALSEASYGVSAAVSSDGGIIAVGARRDFSDVRRTPGTPGDDVDTGAVYVYTWTGSEYGPSVKIIPPETEIQSNLHFGHSVALSADGSILVVGGPKYDLDDNAYALLPVGATMTTRRELGISTGRIYVFHRSGGVWDTGTPIDAYDADQTAYPGRLPGMSFFGYSVGISNTGDRIAAGAHTNSYPGDDPNDSPDFVESAGAVYILTLEGAVYTQTKRTATNDRRAHDEFGASVAVSGDGNSVVVGAPRSDSRGNESGSVYLYRLEGGSWLQTPLKYSGVDSKPQHRLGTSVDISNDGYTIAAGTNVPNTIQGSATVFAFRSDGTSGTGLFENTFKASDGLPGDSFGGWVGISGDSNILVIGAPFMGDGTRPGSVYVYR